MKRLIRISIGSGLLVLGVAGLFLPFLQGGLLIALGGIVLSRDIRLFARMEQGITGRFPAIGRAMVKLRKRFPLLDGKPG